MTIKLIPHKPDNIIGININGKIEAEDIERVIELIERLFITCHLRTDRLNCPNITLYDYNDCCQQFSNRLWQQPAV